MIDALLRRPGGVLDVLADLARAAAPVSVVVGFLAFGWVEAATMMLVFGGVLLARAAALPAVLDGLTSLSLLAAAWFGIVDLYDRIWWVDLATHLTVAGVVAALARILLERWDAAALGTTKRPVSAASVVAGALIGASLALAVSVVWEFMEWWGHTYIDEGIFVGYEDTLGDLAAGGLGGLLAGALLARFPSARTR